RAESSSSAREGSWADSSAGSTKLQSAGLIMERERLREVSQPAPTPGTPARSRGSPLGHFAPRGTAPRSPLPAPVQRTSSRRPVCRMARSEEHTSELQSRGHLVCRLLLEKKKKYTTN